MGDLRGVTGDFVLFNCTFHADNVRIELIVSLVPSPVLLKVCHSRSSPRWVCREQQ